jgi:hypothetical protein
MGGPPHLAKLSPLLWTSTLLGWAGRALWNQAQRKKAVEAFGPGGGLKLVGTAADQEVYLAMVRREMLRSNRFYALMMDIKANTRYPVEITVGRDQKGITIDSFDSGRVKFGAQELDLADLAKLPVDPPAGQPNACTQGEALIHAMAEASAGANTADAFASHAAGIQAQNDYRDERGQKGHRLPADQDPETYGRGDWTLFYDNGYRERWERSGTSITKIVRYTAAPP